MTIVSSVIPRFRMLAHPLARLSHETSPPLDEWVRTAPGPTSLHIPKIQAAALQTPLVHHSGVAISPLQAVQTLIMPQAFGAGDLSVAGPLSPIARAILPDGRSIPPDSYEGGYHGTTAVPPEVAMRDGLPARGDDWRLQEHAEQHSHSAFRGTTLFPTDPTGENGASYWAGEGGWVYEIRGVPTWDVNAQLEGRVKTLDGHFRGNKMYGENEKAIPARVPVENIKRFGRVESDASGHLCVHHWVQNPAYKGH